MTTKEKSEDLPIKDQLKILFGASKAFWLVNMVNFADGICYFGILTLLTRFLGTRVGMNDQVTGFTVSTFTGIVSIFMFFGGFFSDRFGVRKSLTFSLGLLLLGRILLSAAPGFGTSTQIITWSAIILMAIAEGIIQPCLYAGIKEYTDPRTASIGYGLLYSIMNLGIVAENFVSPWVRTSDVFLDLRVIKVIGLGWGIDGVFWICTALTALMLLIHMSFFTRKVDEAEYVPQETEEEKSAHSKLNWKEKLLELPFLDGRFMFFIFILLPVRTLFAHQWLTLPDYVFRVFPKEVGDKFEWISGINPLIIVVGVPLVTALTRKVKVINMMIIGTTLTAVTTFLLVPSPSLGALIAYCVLFSVGEALWSSRFLEYVASIAPAGRLGAYMGLSGIPWFFAKFTTGLYSGWMLEKFVPAQGTQDSSTLWLIYGFIACVSPVALLMSRKWVIKH